MIAAAGRGGRDPRGRALPRGRRQGRRRSSSTGCGRADGRLLHTYKDGQAKFNAYLDDYANLIDGLTRLYEATGEPRWIEAALELGRVMIDEFADPSTAGSSTPAAATRP